MHIALLRAGTWLRRRAENILAALLTAMFVAFLIQIVARYVFNFPVGWTYEVSLLTWLWGVLWGAAFVVTEREEIRFDIVYGAVGAGLRRLFTIVSGLALIALYTTRCLPWFLRDLHEGRACAASSHHVRLAVSRST